MGPLLFLDLATQGHALVADECLRAGDNVRDLCRVLAAEAARSAVLGAELQAAGRCLDPPLGGESAGVVDAALADEDSGASDEVGDVDAFALAERAAAARA